MGKRGHNFHGNLPLRHPVPRCLVRNGSLEGKQGAGNFGEWHVVYFPHHVDDDLAGAGEAQAKAPIVGPGVVMVEVGLQGGIECGAPGGIGNVGGEKVAVEEAAAKDAEGVALFFEGGGGGVEGETAVWL